MQQVKPIVKRIEKQGPSPGRDSPGPSGAAGKQLYTAAAADREEAIESKLRLLRGSVFGRPVMKFDVGKITDVWVPYCYLEYRFSVERNILFRKKGIVKTGEVGLVFDMNEMHPFQYDLYESGELPLKKGPIDTGERKLIKSANSVRDAEVKAEDYIQYKIMKKFYGTEGRLTLRKKNLFYRPAVELEIIYKGTNKNLRYAYLDEFAVENEHVLGLKYRVDNQF